MLKINKKQYWLLSLLSIATIFIGIKIFSSSSDSPYFAPTNQRQLLEDEQGQWLYVKSLYKKMDATGDTFKDWDHSQKDMWKYAIAFLSYGLPSLAMISPKDKDEIVYFFSIMIEKMKSKHVWGDWQEYGFGDDPICRQNIMYKGHLNLMYGLYQLMSGDQRYATEYSWLTQQIVQEMRDNSSRTYRGVVCEPDQYFTHCNAIGLLSLHIYDRLYQTQFTDKEVKNTISFMETKLTDPITGLFWESYHPSHDIAVKNLSGYTNAWAISLLKIFNPQKYAALYLVWKKTFVEEWGPGAFVKESPLGGPSRIASLFGLLAAKEFGDEALFKKLVRTTDYIGLLRRDMETGQMKYQFADNTLLNGMSLAFKLHFGFAEIISHDWQTPSYNLVPDTSSITWTKILKSHSSL